MNTIAIEPLLKPVSAEQPAGPDLEYDPQFLSLNEASTGIPERIMGDSVVPAQDPDWRRVLDIGTALLGRSKDLRAAVRVTRALCGIHGLPGLQCGLDLVHGLLVQYWDGLYPELDASDNNDPTARVNALLELADRDTLLAQLRTTPLVRSGAFGRVSWREVEIAEGRAQAAPGTPSMDAAALAAAFQDCDLEQLAAATAAAKGSLTAIEAINAALAERLARSQLPSLDPLAEPLKHIHVYLQTQLRTRQPDAPEADPGQVAAEVDAAPAAAARPAAAPGQIASREDVVRTLKLICDYYARSEPSSPVPLLLKRAQRLATGSFLDILRDLAPDALTQVEKVLGDEKNA